MNRDRSVSTLMLLIGLGASCSSEPSASTNPSTGQPIAGMLAAAGSGTAAAAGQSARQAGASGAATSTPPRAGMSAPASGAAGKGQAGMPSVPMSMGMAGRPTTANAGSSGSAPAAGSGGAPVAGAAAGSGSSGPCDMSDPPADVKAWVDESWNAQLGMNIQNRKAWNLDNVMLNKGELNLCVRWGASSAVPDAVRNNVAATTERWFNDWFKGLGNYGCFPYGAGIKVKVTGWAVRKGQESLLGQLDPSVPVYTETDNDGEPKCPDACSSFVHWDHVFSDCKGGDAAHSDYWLWFDDNLPGGGGAAAVGGDWGLRMPVKTFLDAFERPSFNITEHEMGHGFGFQDYYDWTGSKPKGGSIMIVQSTDSQTPTTADVWLLRRTWKEMKSLRKW